MKMKMKRKIEIDLNLNYEEVAEGFWNLDSDEQAMFFNHLAKNKKFDIAMRLECIRLEDGLNRVQEN